MNNKRKHAIIKGWVQGVFFRATLQQKAYELEITGWVKNNYNGSVEAVFEGENKNIDKIIEWCHHGPHGASVKEVLVKDEEYTGSFAEFSIKYR
jgi:acylphosphatase